MKVNTNAGKEIGKIFTQLQEPKAERQLLPGYLVWRQSRALGQSPAEGQQCLARPPLTVLPTEDTQTSTHQLNLSPLAGWMGSLPWNGDTALCCASSDLMHLVWRGGTARGSHLSHCELEVGGSGRRKAAGPGDQGLVYQNHRQAPAGCSPSQL